MGHTLEENHFVEEKIYEAGRIEQRKANREYIIHILVKDAQCQNWQ